MSIWSQMITALRGGVNEAGESIIDAQALRILDQEVREATEELKRSKDELASIMARQKLAEEGCGTLAEAINEHESYVEKALQKKNDKLALEIAEKIASMEEELRQEKDVEQEFRSHVTNLKNLVKHAEQDIKRMKQQIDTVKATASVQRAQSAIAARKLGSQPKLHTAMDSLQKIKDKQSFKAAELSAAAELAEENDRDPLQAKLEQAGIVLSSDKAQTVLERIKNKTKQK